MACHLEPGTGWRYRRTDDRRCTGDACRDAHAAYLDERDPSRVDRATGRTCGLRSTYVHGCRCVDCTRAERTYRRLYRRRRRAAGQPTA